MIINVTQDHISKGRRHRCEHCPIALALKEQTGLCCIVTDDNIQIDNKVYDHTVESRGFIFDFDMGYIVKPFSFELGEPIREDSSNTI